MTRIHNRSVEMNTRNLKSPKHKTAVITKESDVPEGYVPITRFRELHGDAMATKMSHAHKDGFIRAVKLMRTADDRSGPVWVHQDDWQAYLKSTEPPQPPNRLDVHRDWSPDVRGKYDVLEEINTRMDTIESAVLRHGGFFVSMLEKLEAIHSTLENIERIWSPERKSGS